MELSTRAFPEQTDAPEGRRLSAVVYADMAGYSRLIGEDDVGTSERLAELRADLIDPALVRHGGRLVNTAGDSLLLLFDSILAAMRFAIEMQRATPSFDGDYAPERRIRFRVGVNVGDVIVDGMNMHGDGINVAARLQSICPVGAICVSRIVRDQVGSRLGLPFKELGAVTLKNIERPVEAFVLDPAQAHIGPTPRSPESRKRTVAFAGLACIAVAAAGLTWSLRSHSPAWIATTAHDDESDTPPLSIAVLPFTNLSGDPDQTYLADGIAEDLTTDLVHLAGAFVVSRESAFSFRGKAVDIREIGRQLGVRYLLEGSVRKIGTNVRINAQLIAAQTGAHLWAERFDKPIASLGQGQDDIVAQLGSALGANLINLDAARAAHAQSGSPAAFDLVLRARAVLNDVPSQDRGYISLGLFLQALRADPTSVPAMAGAAGVFAGSFTGSSAVKRASELVAAAEGRAPNSPDVVAAKFLLLQREQRTREAKEMYLRLLDVNPSVSGLIVQFGLCRCWTTAADALPLLERTIRLNPRSPNINSLKREYARSLLLLGRNDDSIAVLEPLISWVPASPVEAGEVEARVPEWQNSSRLLLAIAYVRAGRLSEARQLTAKALVSSGLSEFTVRSWLRGIGAYSDPDSTAQLRKMAGELSQAGVPDHLDETADSGVASDGELRVWAGVNSPTPMTIPGGRVVLTRDVVDLLGHATPVLLSTSNMATNIPDALFVDLPATGSIKDDWQPRLARLMQELTGGELQRPVVVFGYNQNRWHSRNLALRVIALGYTNVLWYRGGWEAWEASGQRLGPQSGRRNL